MTSGELKFTMRVEVALNTAPDPEFRQLLVETLLVLYNLVEYRAVTHFGGNPINVEEIVRVANRQAP
jgi:phosphorylase kinase alpha/beta subunit